MENLKYAMMLLFMGLLNFFIISCRETREREHDEMDHMEMQHEEMNDDDMEMEHNKNIDHEH